MKTLGVIGGLGPMATAYFLQLVTQMSDAKTDQDHMEIIMLSKPSIPDRTKYIIGQSADNPVGEMILAGKKLKEDGADLIAIPCITAHYFHDELEKEIGVPVIHAIEETGIYLKNTGVEQIGVLATDGTVQSHLFQKCMSKYGINCIMPEQEAQRKVMSIIYDNIKAGKKADIDAFNEITAELILRGAQVVLLGCTELSLLKRDNRLQAGCLDVMEVLARKAVENCNRLREEYRNLITV